MIAIDKCKNIFVLHPNFLDFSELCLIADAFRIPE